MEKKTAIIIGAGPAGLTAAYELLTKSENIKPIILETEQFVGGISRTATYKGNRMDIGGFKATEEQTVAEETTVEEVAEDTQTMA